MLQFALQIIEGKPWCHVGAPGTRYEKEIASSIKNYLLYMWTNCKLKKLTYYGLKTNILELMLTNFEGLHENNSLLFPIFSNKLSE